MVTARRRCMLPRSIQIELIKYFCAGVTARSASELSWVNRNTAILFFHKLRETIHEEIEKHDTPQLSGEVELDESYLVVDERANVGVVLGERFRSLGF